MTEADAKNFQPKLEITQAAMDRYIHQNGSFSMHDIADDTGMHVARIFEYFTNKDEIIRFYYTSLIIRYRLMIDEIADFGQFTLSEKLSNFVYASFDMMQEHEAFVEQTFSAYILHSCKKTTYEQELEELFEDFFEHDDGKSASSDFFINDRSLSLLKQKYLLLVSLWLQDESDGKEMSLELTDKLTGLLEELAYTSVADRGIDLAKFLYANNIFKKTIPCLKQLSSTFEVH